MFWFGLMLGVLVTAMVAACWADRAGWLGPVTPYSSRQAIWDIERRTMHELLAAELAAQRADSLDGTATEDWPS